MARYTMQVTHKKEREERESDNRRFSLPNGQLGRKGFTGHYRLERFHSAYVVDRPNPSLSIPVYDCLALAMVLSALPFLNQSTCPSLKVCASFVSQGLPSLGWTLRVTG